MITNALYKNYCNQIAKLFCVDEANKVLCEASTAERLKNTFDDNSFSLFLANISYGRVYEGYFKNYRVDQNTQRRYVDLFLTDIITGITIKLTWNWLMSGNFFQQLKNALSANNYEITFGNKVFDQGNYMEKRIYYNKFKPSYGITFVPGSVGGGGTAVPPAGGGGTVIKTPDQTVQAPVTSQFDLSGLLSNPIFLIGGGIVLFLLIKNKL